MKITRIQYLSFVLLIFSLAACERPLEIETSTMKKLAVNSTFTPDSSWAVFVTQPEDPFSTTPNFSNIEDAMVEVFENGQKIVELMFSESNQNMEAGYYRPNTSSKPKEGNTYTIKISAENFPIAYATDSIPTTNFTLHHFINKEAANEEDLLFQINLEDLGGRESFYQLSLIQNAYVEHYVRDDTLYHFVNKQYIPLTAKEYDALWTIPSELDGGFEMLNKLGFIFRNQGVHPFVKNIQLRSEIVPIDAPQELVYRYTLEVRQLSKSYFLYQKSLSDNQITQHNPLAEPHNFHNNIVNGFGNFAGYSYRLSSEVPLDLP